MAGQSGLACGSGPSEAGRSSCGHRGLRHCRPHAADCSAAPAAMVRPGSCV